MERRLTVLNATEHFASEREHRLLFDTANPESRAPVVPEQGGLNDFNRLHAGRETNENNSKRSYENVRDRTSERMAKYNEHVSKLTQAITKIGAALLNSTSSARTRVTGFINDLQNVYQSEYTNSAGQQVQYREGMYNTVNNIESAYRNVESLIANIEQSVIDNNGGRMPDGLLRYADRVRIERTNAALQGVGNGSVDVRTYTVPFARESMSQTSTYSLLRVPSNFTFNWTPEAAAVINGKYDTQTGMSNGISYLRLLPAAATGLIGMRVPVTVAAVGDQPARNVIATFEEDGTINEGGSTANKLIKIVYTAEDGGQEPDLEEETPEQIAERKEKARVDYHEEWIRRMDAVGTAEGLLGDVDPEDTPERILALQNYTEALRLENEHLSVNPTELEWPENDARAAEHVLRRPIVAELFKANTEALANLREYAAFAVDAERMQRESEDAIKDIPNAPKAANDVQGWKLRLEAIKNAVGIMTTEQTALGAFPGSPAAQGATPTQVERWNQRGIDVGAEIENWILPEAEAQEGLNEAERLVFDEKWKELKEESDRTRDGYDEYDGTDDVEEKISRLGEHVAALKTEQEHLAGASELQDTKEGGDDRFTTWGDRAGELGGDGGIVDKMEQRLEEYKAFKEFTDQLAREEDVTDGLEKAIPEDPESNDVEGWEGKEFAVKAYSEQLQFEMDHINTFAEGTQEYAGATENQIADIAISLEYVTGEQCEMVGVEIPRVEEATREARRQRFDEVWTDLKDDSEAAAPWEDGNPEDTEAKIGLLQTYVDALDTELKHLTGDKFAELEDTKEGGDERFTAWSDRTGELGGDGGLVDQMQQQLEKFKAFKEFRDNADTYEGESEADRENMPTDPEATEDVAGWRTKQEAAKRYVETRLTPEQDHLNTFEGMIADGATADQTTAVETRKTTVADELTRMEPELKRLDEAVKTAERMVFETEAVRLTGKTDEARDGRDEVRGLDNFGDEVSVDQKYIDAIDAELKHLKQEGNMKYPPTDPVDGNMMRYDQRITELNGIRTEVEGTMEASRSMEQFQKTRAERTEASEKAKGPAEGALEAMDPDNGDITKWGSKVARLEAYAKALDEEGQHIRTLPPMGASDGYRTEVTDRGNAITKILEDLRDPIANARKELATANTITNMPDRVTLNNSTRTVKMPINRFEQISIRKEGTGGTTEVVAPNANLDKPGFPKITRADASAANRHEVTIDKVALTNGRYTITVGTRTCVVQIGRPGRA